MRWLRRAVNRVRGDQNIERLIAAGLEFGQGAFVIHSAYLDPARPWLIKIGARSALSSHVKVFTHDDSMRLQTGLTRIAPVELGKRVFVGAGTTIRPGTRIGANSIIAAGAVVSGEIPPGSVVAGHPAQVITTVTRFQAWQRRALAGAPIWPREGWIPGLGITDERKASQREALATVREGYSEPGESRRRVYARSKVAEWLATSAEIGWRGLTPRRMKRLIADRLRGTRTIERHVREGLQLGERAFVADEAVLDARRPWLITIGADSYISRHVIIFTHDGSQMQDGLTRIGRVDIGSRVYVGPGAMILPGSQIGNDSIIEAGAVVRGAIPSGSYAIGNPATVMSDTASIDGNSRRAAASGPSWPYEGPSSDHGITDERKPARHEALRSGSSGAPLKRRVIGKLRGERTLEQLLAEGLALGEGASVARRAYIDPGCPWLIAIGDESVISDFVIITTRDPRSRALVGTTRLGRVVIGRRVFVSPGAIILPGTRIGDDSVIDVRAVVCGEIPPGSFVSGNPARIMGDVETMAEQRRHEAANGPTRPHEGPNSDDGITVPKQSQRDAVAEASEGYVRARARRVRQSS